LLAKILLLPHVPTVNNYNHHAQRLEVEIRTVRTRQTAVSAFLFTTQYYHWWAPHYY